MSNDDLIRSYLKEFSQDADKWFIEADFLEQRYEFFKSFFEKENLKKHEWKDFQELGDSLHSLATNKLAQKKAFGNMNHELQKYRDSFYYLAYGEDTIDQRINNLVTNKDYKLDYVGKSTISEIVGYLFPEQFTFYNSRSRDALKALEVDLQLPRKVSLGETLLRYSESIQEIYKLYKEIVGRKTNIPLSFEIDQFFSYLSENVSCGDEKDANKSSQRQFDEGTKFWTYSPGEGGSDWEYCRKNGVAIIGWEELGDLSHFETKDALKDHYTEVFKQEGSGKNNITTCWNFANTLKEGDIIFAKAGRSKLLGAGKVSIGYDFKEGQGHCSHYVKVDWFSKEEKDYNKSIFAIKTLTDVTKYTDFVQMLLEDSKTQEVSLDIKTSIDVDPNLNTIFFGPPGTGKTYEVRKRAVEIIEGESVSDEEYMDKYNSYVQDGRIKFITFHPNYGYENFVEGIFPQEDSGDEGNVSYETRDGSFKSMCEDALAELLEIRSTSNSFENEFEIAFKIFVDEIEESSNQLALKTQSQNKEFLVEYVEKTDGVNVCPESGRKMRISKKRLKEIYVDLRSRNISDPKRTDISKRSLRAYSVSIMSKILSYDVKSETASVRLDKHIRPFDILSNGKYGVKDNAEPYVLVIDEINRGNIASIFGELITLIEPTKRIGAQEELTVELPVSKSIFGVPSNLYILGTMNTADRSVESLDMALRRRFGFEAFYPRYDLKALSTEIEGVKLSKLLETINLRIQCLKDQDYSVGHSYFFGVKSKKDLVEVFENKVVPLLQEYFFDDWEKIGLILGKDVVIKKPVSVSKIFASFNSDLRDAYSDTKLYEILKFDEWVGVENLFKKMIGIVDE